MAEQAKNIPDGAIWIAHWSDWDVKPFIDDVVFYLPETNSYIKAELLDAGAAYTNHEDIPDDDVRFYLDGNKDVIYVVESVHQITKESAARELEGSVVNDSDRAASIIEDLKRFAPEKLFIGSSYEYDSDSLSATAQRLFYSSTSKEFTRDTINTYFAPSYNVRTSSDVISEKEALALINDRNFDHALDYESRVLEFIDNFRRKVENGRSDAERKENTMPEQTKRDIRIKDPDAPASGAQMGLLNALAENGVVTPEEMTALGDSPTKQAASNLINAHAEEEGFKAVQEARRVQRAEANPQRTPAPEAKELGTGKNAYANVKMPAAFLTPHTYTAKDGREFEKVYVHFPQGTKVNGIDLGGYSCDVFMNDRMKQQMLSGEQVTLGFKADEPVTVWTGTKGDEQHPYQRYEVKPWDLVKGIKTANEEFKADKAAEREAAKEQGVSLKDAAKQARDASAALEGHAAPDDRAVAR